MNIAEYAQARYTTKAFDPSRKIPADALAQIRTLLQCAPSSINSQPWHFIIAGSDDGKRRIAKATHGPYAYNAPKVSNASHVVVLCAKVGIDAGHLDTVLEQEDRDGRFATPDAKAGRHTALNFYVDQHRFDTKDVQPWIEKQVYLALGSLLLGAATLGLDACPMEGFDPRVLDEELGLRARGLSSVALVSLGYRSADDFNAKLPKSRLPAETVLSEI